MSILLKRSAIAWSKGWVRFIDQRFLPGRLKIIETTDWRMLARAIRNLSVRGAPLIGITAAMGVALAATHAPRGKAGSSARRAIKGLAETRPTAQNLFWALERMQAVLDSGKSDAGLAKALESEALAIQSEDRECCAAIGKFGARLLIKQARVLTICNTGWLATGGIGTALGVVYTAHDQGKQVRVYACETRPLLQGARLTAWELKQSGIPVTLLADSAAAGLAGAGGVDICIIGADRIAQSGDTANKIGSYQLALACREAGVPFYVAAPHSTIDADCPSGRDIPIEQRDSREVLTALGKRLAPEGVEAFNPAFDVVPSALITGVITEKGIIHPPYDFGESVKKGELKS